MLWSAIVIVAGAMLAPFAWYALEQIPAAQAQAQAQAQEDNNPRANYWRAVRGGDAGYSAVSGPESNVLIQSGGQNWRQMRNGPIANYGGWALLGICGLLLLFFLIRGSVKIEKGRSGVQVPRWNGFERTLHWYTAVLFILLAITGLSLLFGRAVLIPTLGKEVFAGWAEVARTVHNYAGPAFSVGVLLMILIWLKNNLPAKGDLKWFLGGGGMIKGKHPSAGKANAGEKVFVFWLGVFVAGIAVVATGLILDFPIYGQTRDTMQLAQMLHSSSAIFWTVLVLLHAYLGSIGTEGILEGMVRGHVDRNWAEQHHNRWLAEMDQRSGEPGSRQPSGAD
jgi:formate dehydrogenase subunit gamma